MSFTAAIPRAAVLVPKGINGGATRLDLEVSKGENIMSKTLFAVVSQGLLVSAVCETEAAAKESAASIIGGPVTWKDWSTACEDAIGDNGYPISQAVFDTNFSMVGFAKNDRNKFVTIQQTTMAAEATKSHHRERELA
jgi:hypothetical protein